MCLPFIERQIDLADPEYLVCLGASASRAMLGVKSGIMRARGSWFPYVGRSRPRDPGACHAPSRLPAAATGT